MMTSSDFLNLFIGSIKENYLHFTIKLIQESPFIRFEHQRQIFCKHMKWHKVFFLLDQYIATVRSLPFAEWIILKTISKTIDSALIEGQLSNFDVIENGIFIQRTLNTHWVNLKKLPFETLAYYIVF